MFTIIGHSSKGADVANIQAISLERHGNKRWKRISSYSFAAKDSICTLVAQELSNAMQSLPVGFVAHENSYALVAVLGLEPEKNYLIAPNGQWHGSYVPECYRTYPFKLANTEDGRQVLCVDEDSGILTEDAIDEIFFDANNEPSEPIKKILEFQTRFEASRQSTNQIIKVLQDQNLIIPWPIKTGSAEEEHVVEGMHCIDEKALNELPNDAFLKLREAGGLPLVYCQLISKIHLAGLAQVANALGKAKSKTAALDAMAGELNFVANENNGSLNFDNI